MGVGILALRRTLVLGAPTTGDDEATQTPAVQVFGDVDTVPRIYLGLVRPQDLDAGAGDGPASYGIPALFLGDGSTPLGSEPAVLYRDPDSAGEYLGLRVPGRLIVDSLMVGPADSGGLVIDRPSSARLAVDGHLDPGGLNLQTKAGVPSDADVSGAAADGDVVLDTTNHRLYVRSGGTWRRASLTVSAMTQSAIAVTGTIAAGAAVTTSIPWPVVFSNADYVAVATAEGGSSKVVLHIASRTAAAVNVRAHNIDSVDRSPQIHVIGHQA